MKFIFFLILSLSAWAQEVAPEKPAEKPAVETIDVKLDPAKSEPINFNALKEVLKKDGLDQEAKKQEEIIVQKKIEVEKIDVSRDQYPSEEDFWSFMSEYWLVRNAPELKWDYLKPDYGLDVALANFLEGVGFYKKKFKILLVDTSTITHFALPSDRTEYIIIISVPFIRSMDLSKLEISLLCFEDILRQDLGLFKINLDLKPENIDFLGTNFHSTGPDMKKIEHILNQYTEVIYKKGFNFQQQFEVTKKMDKILKTSPPLWSSYVKLLNKIDKLVRVDLLYTDYTKIYPSPEMQIQWISPNHKGD